MISSAGLLQYLIKTRLSKCVLVFEFPPSALVSHGFIPCWWRNHVKTSQTSHSLTDRASHKLQMVILVHSLTLVIILRKKIRNYKTNTQFLLFIWHKNSVNMETMTYLTVLWQLLLPLLWLYRDRFCNLFLLLSVHTANSRIKVKREPKSRVIFLLVHTVIARSHKRKVPIKPKKPFPWIITESRTLRWSPLWIPNFTYTTRLHFTLDSANCRFNCSHQSGRREGCFKGWLAPISKQLTQYHIVPPSPIAGKISQTTHSRQKEEEERQN